jgi:hypothetical protein
MSVVASFVSEFWHDQLVVHDRQALFLVLVGFLGSFGFIRMSTRIMRSPRLSWWPGSVVSEGGVHVHHLVFGICLMLVGGTLGYAFFDSPPWREICALVFGIGAGLTIDEFALWVYLDDVYWTRQGRVSIDATVIAAGAMGLVLLGARPFDVVRGTSIDAIATAAGVLIVLAVVVICFAKQRVMHGAVGLFFLPLAIYGASRIGKPHSPWAKRFYGARRPRKQAKAEDRFRPDRRTERFKERLRDAIGGAPTDVYEAKLASRSEPPKAEERQPVGTVGEEK